MFRLASLGEDRSVSPSDCRERCSSVINSRAAGTRRFLSPLPRTVSHQHIVPLKELPIVLPLGDAQAAQIQQREEPPRALVVRAVPGGLLRPASTNISAHLKIL